MNEPRPRHKGGGRRWSDRAVEAGPARRGRIERGLPAPTPPPRRPHPEPRLPGRQGCRELARVYDSGGVRAQAGAASRRFGGGWAAPLGRRPARRGSRVRPCGSPEGSVQGGPSGGAGRTWALALRAAVNICAGRSPPPALAIRCCAPCLGGRMRSERKARPGCLAVGPDSHPRPNPPRLQSPASWLSLRSALRENGRLFPGKEHWWRLLGSTQARTRGSEPAFGAAAQSVTRWGGGKARAWLQLLLGALSASLGVHVLQ